MIDVRRADSALRRQVILALLISIFAGALLIVGFGHYHIPMRDWILSEPAAMAQRVNVVFLVLAVFLMAPLLALAVYLWSLSGWVLRTAEFPPKGLRVIRDTPVIAGDGATFRGRLLRALALAFGIASVAVGLLLWRLASLFSGQAA